MNSKSDSHGPNLENILYAILVVVCLVLFLRYLYSALSPLVQPSNIWPPILAHLLVITLTFKAIYNSDLLWPKITRFTPSIQKNNIWFYLPSIIWLVGICLLVWMFFQYPDSIDFKHFASKLFIIALIVPIVEEFFFRGVIGGLLRKKFGIMIGSYCSILIFCFAHTPFSLTNISGLLYLGTGVCLLGIVCEILYVKSQQIYTAVAFHAVANASGVIFAEFCPDLLEKISIFYQ